MANRSVFKNENWNLGLIEMRVWMGRKSSVRENSRLGHMGHCLKGC